MDKFYRLWAWGCLFLYAYIYNDYFGNNMWPKSAEEVICDGIFTLGLLMIMLTYRWGANDK